MLDPSTLDSISVLPEQITNTIDLRRTTALAGCTTMTVSNGRGILAKNWPGLSSGEEQLWHLAAWINAHADQPDLARLAADLDDENFMAAIAAIAQVEARL